MVFSSILFLFYFFPAFLVLYFLTPYRWKNYSALAGSCIFYFWGAPSFFAILLIGLIVDFYLNRLIWYAEDKVKKNLLITVIILNTSMLIWYKYLNFFADNVNSVLQTLEIGSIPLPDILLPIGISFITFQKLSYSIDIYRRKAPVQENFVNYALYILFFPQLIAGPIVRYNEVAAQINDRRDAENIDNKIAGFYRFMIGLGKKVMIANTLGMFVDLHFGSVGEMSSAMAWLVIVAYSFQIYYDFAGYSDMAIGMARMMGFRFPENFNFPYISQNISEFWRRWHITLGSWMRDYLYIPLGGNQLGKRRMYINLWVVFLISGFWHGAAWNFVIWGIFHGLFLIADRVFLISLLSRLGKIPSVLITFLIVLIGWVFFRAETLSYALVYLEKMFSFNGGDILWQEPKFWTVIVVAAFFSFSGLWSGWEKATAPVFRPLNLFQTTTLSALAVVIGLICLTELFASGFNPFIYFRF